MFYGFTPGCSCSCKTPPPPGQSLFVCWLCPGCNTAPCGFSETITYNFTTQRYEGTDVRGTLSGSNITLERNCGGTWISIGSVPITGPYNFAANPPEQPPYTALNDPCCTCGKALVNVSKDTPGGLPWWACGLSCENGIFGSPYAQLPAEWDAHLSGLSNDIWDSCASLGDTHTLTGASCSWFYTSWNPFIGGGSNVVPGKNCGLCAPCGYGFITLNTSGLVPACATDPKQCCTSDGGNPMHCVGCFDPCHSIYGGGGCGACGLSISVNFVHTENFVNACSGKFMATVIYGCSCSDGDNTTSRTACNMTANYESDEYHPFSPVPTSVSLHLTSSVVGGTNPCQGGPPTTLTLNGV